jgi:hypothetical protein
MTRGQRVVYRCLAGFRYDAEVVTVRLDGTVDLAVDAGCNDHVQLTRIEIAPELRPGTCREGSREGR